jgi:2-octaprenyl-6-methoxyphenol hydroxylase
MMTQASTTPETDIAVIGTGPTGLVAALLLAQADYSLALIGPEPVSGDGRTTAIMQPGLELVAPFGLDPATIEDATPLRTMRIIDGTARLIRSPVVTFHASEIGQSSFGHNIPNRALNAALWHAVTNTERVHWMNGLAQDIALEHDHARIRTEAGTVHCRLAVGADGRDSLTRQTAGIAVSHHAYPQTAIVCAFSHSRGHGNVSTEFHTESGPCTLVPLAGNRSSVVWVVDPAQVDALMHLDEDQFALQLEQRVQSILGKLTLDTKRQAWPLSSMTAHTYVGQRVALVGEAAHLIPPIGAQGFNLGLRDCKALAEILSPQADDPGQPALLQRYHSERQPDVRQRTGTVNALNQALLSNGLAAQLARAFGLQSLASIAPLRAFAMREGLAPRRGFSGLFKRVG